jgi:exosortase
MNSNSLVLFKAKYVYSLIVVLIACSFSLFFPTTVESYLVKWSKFDESLGHGFLVVGIVIFEIFKSFGTYQPVKEKSNHFLLIVILLTTLFHEIASFWGILIFQQFSLYIIWGLAISYILGYKSFKQMAFPFIFFLFAVPFWEFSNTFFVDLTTFAVTILLSFTDLTVFIYDNFIETPFGIIEVAEGCSGIRYFEIGLALAVYAVHGERLSWRLKLLVILTGAILGIITNWIRVLGLIYIGYTSEMKSPLMSEHDNYGFLLFFVVISGVIFLVNWLSKKYSLPAQATPNTVDSNSINLLPLSNIGIKSLATFITIMATSYISHQNIDSTLNVKTIKDIDNISAFNILSNYGAFTENSADFILEERKCTLISRRYNFITPGENVLPYDHIYNQDNFKALRSSSSIINYSNENIDVMHLELRGKLDRKKYELYYWYEYNTFYTSNKYIAKVFEISYLLKTESKLKLHAVLCAN